MTRDDVQPDRGLAGPIERELMACPHPPGSSEMLKMIASTLDGLASRLAPLEDEAESERRRWLNED